MHAELKSQHLWNSQQAIAGDAFSRDGDALCIDTGGERYTLSTSYLTKYYSYNPETQMYVPSTGSELCTLMENGSPSRIVAPAEVRTVLRCCDI